MITGQLDGFPSTILYLNDGQGKFIVDDNTPFLNVSRGAAVFSDVDGDGDQDVLIAGQSAGNSLGIYFNDGAGNFSMATTNIQKGSNSALVFVDVDGDNDKDVLTTGDRNFNNYYAKLYTNDGSGSFTEVSNTPFEEVIDGTIIYADVDGDDDQDLMLTGINENSIHASKLYLNDGQGNFTEMEGTSFEDVSHGAVAFNDIDGDGDKDLLITGQKIINDDYISKLYINNGQGSFTETEEPFYEGVSRGSIAFADVDGDNDDDVLITGERSAGEDYISHLFFNDGQGNFMQAGIPQDPLQYGSITFLNVNGDAYDDLFITGRGDSNIYNSKLFINDQNYNFVEQKDAPFEDVSFSAVAYADVDGDNDQDILISGRSVNNCITKLYQNDGQGNFTEMVDNSFIGIEGGSVAFADVDGDNDQDLFINGYSPQGFNGLISKLYLNDGQGNFTESTIQSFAKFEYGAIAFSDIDGDNDQDLLLTGKIDIGESIIYINDGQGNFTSMFENPLIGVQFSAIAFADVDGDDDEDLLITGSSFLTESNQYYTSTTDKGIFQKYPIPHLMEFHMELLLLRM